MTTLKTARDHESIEQFIAERGERNPGDESLFNATLAAMAGTSKAIPATSGTPLSDD